MSRIPSIEELANDAEQVAAERIVEGLVVDGHTARELRDTVPAEPDWIIPGLLARGWTLMVSAREKTGKGTLISYLLGRIEKGQPTVFGESNGNKLTAMVYTEEPPDSIREKVADADAEQTRYVFSWDLPSEVKRLPHKDGQRWTALIDVLIRSALAHECSILFIDNVSRAAGVEEEAGTEMSRRVEQASDKCKDAGLTLIVDHHHRKSGGDMRDRSRGGTGTVGAVDVSLAMGRGEDENDRRRELSCVGRRKACVWACTIQLNEEGTEYAMLEREDGDTASSPRRGGAALEQRRVDLLAALCQARHAETGSEFVTAEDVAALWGVTVSTAKEYMKDRIPNGRFMAGPQQGRARTYAVPGWQDVDTDLGVTSNPDAPSF